jgi:hypothetical protein
MIPLVFWAISISGWGTQSMGAMRVAMLLAAVAVWVVGTKLNSEAMADDEAPPHQAFGFPMQWSALIGVGGFVLTFF